MGPDMATATRVHLTADRRTHRVVCVENARGSEVAVATAALAAAVGPMVIEVPFDLIVMTTTYPVTDPALFRLLLFGR
jgi:hypothetical protein